jgi:hypothetical protein
LPFKGGQKLRLELAIPSVFAGGGVIGFWLSSEKPGNVGTAVVTRARTTVVEVSSVGKPKGRGRTRIQKLAPLLHGHVGGISLGVRVGSAPAFYRADTYLLDRTGATVVHYAAYFRVVPRRVDVRLGLVDDSVSPGGVLRFRPENRGTLGFEYGYEFTVEHREGGRWLPDPSSPEGFPQPSITLPPGRAGICQGFHLPAGMEPGAYRISKPVRLIGGAGWNLRATFSVSG